MPVFDSDGVDIAYQATGEGEPILLIHGFASNRRVNWVSTGWTGALEADGRQVIAVDNRGHGESQKLHDPADYGAPTMADDAARLLRHLDVRRADVMGYSMGARIAAFLAINHPSLVRSVVFGGLGERMITGVGGAEEIARGLEAGSAEDVADPEARAFRTFADATGSDRRALAACMRSSRETITTAALGQIAVPVLVAVGTEDRISGPPAPLAAALRHGRVLPIPGRDHMKAVGDKVYKQGVLDFLASRP